MSASEPLSRRDAAHLLRRAAFGGTPKEIDKLTGARRQDAVAKLFGKTRKGRGPAPKEGQTIADRRKLQAWWLQRMLGKSGAHEKLVLFWHDHFAAPAEAVTHLRDVAAHNGVLREYGLGRLRDLLYQVTRDPNMLSFLDGFSSSADSPNENYAREFMELFTLGPKDVNGVDNYSQDDVMELARCFTGFRWDDKFTQSRVVVSNRHFDDGFKVLFAGRPFEVHGHLGVETVSGAEIPEHRNVIDLMFTHRDSDGRPTLARFIARKLWEWYAYPDPPLALVDELADAFAAGGYVVRDLLQAILTHDAFYGEQARTSSAKTPVDFIAHVLRGLDIKADMTAVASLMREMGMELFEPPSVNGWNHGEAWLSASRYLARFQFAQRAVGDSTNIFQFKGDKLLGKEVPDTPTLVDGLLERLGVAPSVSSRQVLIDYADGGAALSDQDWFEKKFRGLLILMLTLPEFQVQ